MATVLYYDINKSHNNNYLKSHFIYFSVVSSLNHALAYVVIAYASSLLDEKVASTILGLSWLLNAFSGLFLTTYITKLLGYRLAMFLAHIGFTIQMACLYISILYPEVAMIVCISGSIFSGITSAIFWTAQGMCFELTADKISDNMSEIENPDGHSDKSLVYDSSQINTIRATLSARWTIIYQSADIIVFFSLSILPLYLHANILTVLLAITLVGVITSLLALTYDTLGHKEPTLTWVEVRNSIFSVPQQFMYDSRATLIAPFVFGFGITTSMFAYYINGKVTAHSHLGVLAIGMLESFSYLIAALSAYPYAYICSHVKGGNHIVMQFGSLAFMLSGVVVLFVGEEQLALWYVSLVVRTLYGLGRGVFEGACRSVYADLFAGDDLAAAFSSQTLLAGASGGICFLVYRHLTRTQIASITITNGIIAILFYAILALQPQTRLKHNKPIPWHGLYILKLLYKNDGVSYLSSKYNNNGSSAHLLDSYPTHTNGAHSKDRESYTVPLLEPEATSGGASDRLY